jgi:serine kinase of HPr protein (carbohydrate metabolism regulator)
VATTLSSETLHASCVTIDGRAVLITGPSGSGKSDLALRLIDRGATLISDDYTIVRREGTVIRASAPERIAGMIEVRGLGLMPMPHSGDAPVALVIALAEPIERMPESEERRMIAGVSLPVVRLAAFEGSTPIKVALAMKRLNA